MQQVINSIRYGYAIFSGLGINLVLLWSAVIYLLLYEKSKDKRNLLYMVFVLLFFLLNPFTANNLMTFGAQQEYWKAFSMIPTAILIAYSMVKLIASESEKRKKRYLVAGFLMVLLISSNFDVAEKPIGIPENKYILSSEIVEVQQIVSPYGDAYVMAPRTVAEQLREYDASIRVLGGDGEKWSAIEEISKDWTDSDKIYSCAVSYGVTCIVTPKPEDGSILDPTRFGLIGQTENYCIYLK